jgi:ABC-type amino acid transport substrate-binding protein
MPIGIATHKDTDEALAKSMRQALNTLTQSGQLESITARWFTPTNILPTATE